jgi:chromosome segregation ATPase
MGPTGLATKVEVEDARAEFNQKIDYCLKTLAQMNQSVYDAGKTSTSANTDVKEMQQLVSSLEKNVKVFENGAGEPFGIYFLWFHRDHFVL